LNIWAKEADTLQACKPVCIIASMRIRCPCVGCIYNRVSDQMALNITWDFELEKSWREEDIIFVKILYAYHTAVD